MPEFKIPRQTDLEIVTALSNIRSDMADFVSLSLRINMGVQGIDAVEIQGDSYKESKNLNYIIEEDSSIIKNFYLVTQDNAPPILEIQRPDKDFLDSAICLGGANAAARFGQDDRGKIAAKLISSARRNLRAGDVDALLSGGSENTWTRYRDAMGAVLTSLQETSRTILTEAARKALEADAAARSRLEGATLELENEYKSKSEALQSANDARMATLDEREASIKSREENFETKEARYVARQQLKEQLDQVKGRLEKWSLTQGTTAKRNTVTIACVASGIFFAAVAIWYGKQLSDFLAAIETGTISPPAWQWAILSLKTIVPLTVVVSVFIFYIRWSAAWARQHADEEFRNLARVLDIGRTAWLLEAVRDAQAHEQSLPPDLVKELSRNLFAQTPSDDGPEFRLHAALDLLTQKLASLRLRSPDGTEVEAKRR